MKFAFRGVSGVALLFGLSGGMHSAWAQQTATPANPNQTVTTAQTGASASGPATQVDQTQPAQEAATSSNRVVVVGSLLNTKPEDSPKPVEIYTAEDMKEGGAPSVAEFIRDLPVNYSITGQDTGIGGLNFADLRGLGNTATMATLNGRRLGTNNGTGADLSTIPENALAAVEVLKDGASTTYGAGAVAGVINFTTRRDVDSPEFSIERRLYDGSNGEFTFDFQTGWVGDSSNLLLTYSYQQSAPLMQTERGFSSQPFTVNPEAYTLQGGNPGAYTLLSDFYTARAVATPAAQPPGAPPTAIVYTNPPNFFDLPGGVNGHNDPRRLIQDYGAAAGCTAIGGQLVQSLLPGRRVSADASITRLDNSCALPEYQFRDLVSKAEQHQIYSELNADITENMAFHVSALYSTSTTHSRDLPVPLPTNGGQLRYDWANSATQVALNAGARDDTTCAGACLFVIPTAVQTYTVAGAPSGTFVRNPFVNDFITRTGSNPADFSNGTALYTGPGWRPFLFGGNQHSDTGLHENSQQTERLVLATELKGKFAGEGVLSLLNGIKYLNSMQFNMNVRTSIDSRLVTSRLQNALMGYGGAGCLARDRVVTNYDEVNPFPNSTSEATQIQQQQMRARYNNSVGVQSDTAPGTNGCMFFNPFVSSWRTSIANGAINPNYGGAAFGNPQELIDWMFFDRTNEDHRLALSMDTFYSGTVPEKFFSLPGGEIGWGVGLNWRQTELRSGPITEGNGLDFEGQHCPYPDPVFDLFGVTRKPTFVSATGTSTVLEPDQAQGNLGCSAAGQGPGAFTTGAPNYTTFTDEQTMSGYAELALPILDNLNGQLSWRRESFNNRRIEGDIYSVAAKYDITDELYVRGSYSTNFRVDAALNETPGRIEVIDRFTLGRFANTPIIRLTEIDPGLKPEDDRSTNLGIGYNNRDFFGGSLTASLDFFEIIIDGEVVGGAGTAALTASLEATFRTATGTIPITAPEFDASFAQCSSPLIVVWEFKTGNCVQGVTQGSDTAIFKSITQNGGGYITNGLDYAINYSMPFWDGTLSFDGRATQVLHHKNRGFSQFGIPVEGSFNQLGYGGGLLNSGRSIEVRGNFSTRFSNENHTLNFRMNYDSGIKDPAYTSCFEGDVAGATCGSGLEVAHIDPTTGVRLTGGAALSDYGADQGPRITLDLTYIFRAPFWQDLEFRSSLINITNEDPFLLQGDSGYAIGDPRGRILELEVSKKF